MPVSRQKSPAPAKTRQRRSSHEVRDLILKSAADLFVRHGYDRTSTREIAETAGVVEPMIFRHFGTKENLFENAVFMPFAGFVDEYLKKRRQYESGDLSQQKFSEQFVGTLYDLLHRNRGLIRELLSVGSRAKWRLVHANEPESPFALLFSKLEEISSSQIKSGQQRGTDPILATRITFGSILAMAILGDWMFPDRKSRPGKKEIVEELRQFILFGITPLNAREPEARPTPPRKRIRPAKP